MSERNRGHYLGAPLAAIALLAVAYFNAPQTVSVGKGETEQDCPNKTYSVRSGPDGGFEFAIARDEKACKNQESSDNDSSNTPHAPRNVQEADLLAQQQMAHWTLWIAVFTAVGLAVLYITFHATREAVVETREIGQKQTRAYVSATKARYIESTKQPLSVELTLKNTGQSPAMGVMFTPKFILTIVNDRPPNTKDAVVLEVRGWPSFGQTIAAQTELNVEIKLDPIDARKHVPFAAEILDVGIQADIMFNDVFTTLQFATIDISEVHDGPILGLPRQQDGQPLALRTRTSEGKRSKPVIDNQRQKKKDRT